MKHGDVGRFFVWEGRGYEPQRPTILELDLRFCEATHETWFETLDGLHTFGGFVDTDRERLIKHVIEHLQYQSDEKFKEWHNALFSLDAFKKYNNLK